jgi:hypothetical protein
VDFDKYNKIITIKIIMIIVYDKYVMVDFANIGTWNYLGSAKQFVIYLNNCVLETKLEYL